MMKQKLKEWINLQGMSIAVVFVLAFSSGMIIAEKIRAPKVVVIASDSEAEKWLGSCKLSGQRVEGLTLNIHEYAVDAFSDVLPRDITCSGFGSNLEAWETKEGVTFDSAKGWNLWPGAKVKVSGPFYLVGGKHMVIHTEDIEYLNWNERPAWFSYSTPTPTPLVGQTIIVTPTPARY